MTTDETNPEPEIEITATDPVTGEIADTSVLESSGVAYDPAAMHLDLTKEEKRRTTALMLTIQAYKEIIIKDAEYLREAAKLARKDEGPQIRSATMDAMVRAAIKFDHFIAGGYGPENEDHQEHVELGE